MRAKGGHSSPSEGTDELDLVTLRPVTDAHRPTRIGRHTFTPRPGGLGPEFVQRAERLANEEWPSLTEAVLVTHLLLEQALTERIAAKFRKPEVLSGSRLSFAQLLTMYAGLYDPEEEDLKRLAAFNHLRNKVAHTLEEPSDLIVQTLSKLASGISAAPTILRVTFFYLFCGELFGVQRVTWVDT
jgi:hypothetical protein